jgi:hypothetical protein
LPSYTVYFNIHPALELRLNNPKIYESVWI